MAERTKAVFEAQRSHKTSRFRQREQLRTNIQGEPTSRFTRHGVTRQDEQERETAYKWDNEDKDETESEEVIDLT